MREKGEIRKIKFKEVVPPVFRDLKKKPKLLVPFIISFIVNFIILNTSLYTWLRFISGEWSWRAGGTESGIFGTIFPLYGLFYVFSILWMLVSIMISVFFTGWTIICYNTYIGKKDFQLMGSLKRSLKYYWKMVGATLLARLIILIVWGIPSALIWILITITPGSGFYGGWANAISLAFSLVSLVFSTFFIFTSHTIIIEKETVIGSLKRSFHVASGNFWKVYLILAAPLALTIPGIVLGHYFDVGRLFECAGCDLMILSISWIINGVIGMLIALILIRIFITSVIPRRRKRDKWGFKN